MQYNVIEWCTVFIHIEAGLKYTLGIAAENEEINAWACLYAGCHSC